MKLISPMAKMYILIMYQSLLRCLSFSFISIQDYGRQNLAFLAKIFLLGNIPMYKCLRVNRSSAMLHATQMNMSKIQ